MTNLRKFVGFSTLPTCLERRRWRAGPRASECGIRKQRRRRTPGYLRGFCSILAQVSRNGTVRLKTSFSGVEFGSTQK